MTPQQRGAEAAVRCLRERYDLLVAGEARSATPTVPCF